MSSKDQNGTYPSLSTLPEELIGIIAAHLDSRGLASIRATCRPLQYASMFEFHQRYSSSQLEFSGYGRSNQNLIITLQSPDLAKAQSQTMAPILALGMPGEVIGAQALTCDRTPEMESIAVKKATKQSQLAKTNISMLSNFTLIQRSTFKTSAAHELVPSMLQRIAVLAPGITNLCRLAFKKVHVDCDLFTKLLEIHQHHIRIVEFHGAVLTKALVCLRALCRLKVQYFRLNRMRAADEDGGARLFGLLNPLFHEFFKLARLDLVMYQRTGKYDFDCYQLEESSRGERVT